MPSALTISRVSVRDLSPKRAVKMPIFMSEVQFGTVDRAIEAPLSSIFRDMKGTFVFGVLAAGALAAFVFAQSGALNLMINGKAVPGKTLVSKGQTYVPVSALK